MCCKRSVAIKQFTTGVRVASKIATGLVGPAVPESVVMLSGCSSPGDGDVAFEHHQHLVLVLLMRLWHVRVLGRATWNRSCRSPPTCTCSCRDSRFCTHAVRSRLSLLDTSVTHNEKYLYNSNVLVESGSSTVDFLELILVSLRASTDVHQPTKRQGNQARGRNVFLQRYCPAASIPVLCHKSMNSHRWN